MTNTRAKKLDMREQAQSTNGERALNGARLALTQLAADAQVLLNAWQERVDLLQQAEATTTSAIQKGDFQAARQEITRCKSELEGLLKIWEVPE